MNFLLITSLLAKENQKNDSESLIVRATNNSLVIEYYSKSLKDDLIGHAFSPVISVENNFFNQEILPSKVQIESFDSVENQGIRIQLFLDQTVSVDQINRSIKLNDVSNLLLNLSEINKIFEMKLSGSQDSNIDFKIDDILSIKGIFFPTVLGKFLLFHSESCVSRYRSHICAFGKMDNYSSTSWRIFLISVDKHSKIIGEKISLLTVGDLLYNKIRAFTLPQSLIVDYKVYGTDQNVKFQDNSSDTLNDLNEAVKDMKSSIYSQKFLEYFKDLDFKLFQNEEKIENFNFLQYFHLPIVILLPLTSIGLYLLIRYFVLQKEGKMSDSMISEIMKR